MDGSKQIPDRLFFRIGDVADLVGVKPYVLRYWESEFPMVSPDKSATGQRVYRRADVETLLVIKHLLYEERYSIEGARRRLKELKKDKSLKQVKQAVVNPPDILVEMIEAAPVLEGIPDLPFEDEISRGRKRSEGPHVEVELSSSPLPEEKATRELETKPEPVRAAVDQSRLKEMLESAEQLKKLLEAPVDLLFKL
jgi:DNA-binding transcriptional MerR regulator